nr:hypothetical protein [Tanacetum cinerariifolium]
MNYQPVVAQYNDFSGTKANNGAEKEKEPERDYILLPLWTANSPFSFTSKSSQDNEFQPLNDDSHDDEDVFGAEADFYNLDSTFQASPTTTTRIHNDHPLKQFIGDLHSVPQTRRMTKNLEEHGLVLHALKYPSWIEAIQEELLRNKIDERGIVIRNKARLVAQRHTQEEGIDYDEVFKLVSKIKAIRLFLAYASFNYFIVYQMEVKSAFLYGKLEEEMYVCQPPEFEDPGFSDKVYKVKKALYGNEYNKKGTKSKQNQIKPSTKRKAWKSQQSKVNKKSNPTKSKPREIKKSKKPKKRD